MIWSQSPDLNELLRGWRIYQLIWTMADWLRRGLTWLAKWVNEAVADVNWCQVERLVPALAEPQPARKLNMIIPAKKISMHWMEFWCDCWPETTTNVVFLLAWMNFSSGSFTWEKAWLCFKQSGRSFVNFQFISSFAAYYIVPQNSETIKMGTC